LLIIVYEGDYVWRPECSNINSWHKRRDDHVIIQAVTCWFSVQRLRFDPRPICVGFAVNKVALG